MLLREALKHYYESKGMSERWVGPKIGSRYLNFFPLSILPKALRDWMKIHDAHHLITGYETDFAGEAEIAAWVLVRNGLNFGGNPKWLPFMVFGDTFFGALFGFLFMPKRILLAFKKGKAEHSLHGLDADLVLDMEFEEARQYVLNMNN